ncbi:cytochrome P450 4V2-like isoform X3 [Maniola jurtina]|uniref:cytochrome P450 4V2-like isoform X3 n=1 Tax=Maniola jurtina TaxID=191418 RepID=UPI001E68FA8A|nr:cytochrome P450 4V2-like isoform X3 [Maniola jurtina]
MLAVAFILVLLSCGILAWRRRNRNKDEPPTIPGALPLIGHIYLFLGIDPQQLWNTVKKEVYRTMNAGGVTSGNIGLRKVYFVTDPDDCLKIANTCLQKDDFYKFAKPWVGDGLVTADLTVMEVDFSDGGLLNSEYVHATKNMLNSMVERLVNPWLYSDAVFNWSSLKRKQDEYVKILHNMSNTVLKKRKAEYLNNKLHKGTEYTTKGPKFRSFMELLLELTIEKGVFSDREIREHVDTMLFAGHDTTSTSLMYTMLLVGSYPEVQQKIFEELHDVFGDDDRDVTKQDLSRLVYLEAVLNESLRIYPIAPVMARKLDQDIKLRNCTLLKNRTCFLWAYGVHRHPMWGPDAEEFKPERWLDPATLPKCPTAFAGFGMGRRYCIGKTYAMMSMKITLAHVFRRYRVFGNHLLMVTKFEVMLKPVSGHHIAIEIRKKSVKNET